MVVTPCGLHTSVLRYGTAPIGGDYIMSLRRTLISYYQVGHTEIWLNRTSPSTIEVTVYDDIDQTMKDTAVTTLDAAMTLVSDAISKELRRQQGEV